jgi:hypothetical protein
MFSSGWLPLNPISIGFNDGRGILNECYGFGHVTTGLGTWRTHGYLSLFFRFAVLVTVHLYYSL